MYSARWTTIFAAALVGSGLALAQTPERPRIVTVQDASGKLPLQCRVLRSWAEPDGTALEVESITTGERFTLVESGRIVTRPTGQRGNGKVVQEVRSRIYRW